MYISFPLFILSHSLFLFLKSVPFSLFHCLSFLLRTFAAHCTFQNQNQWQAEANFRSQHKSNVQVGSTKGASFKSHSLQAHFFRRSNALICTLAKQRAAHDFAIYFLFSIKTSRFLDFSIACASQLLLLMSRIFFPRHANDPTQTSRFKTCSQPFNFAAFEKCPLIYFANPSYRRTCNLMTKKDSHHGDREWTNRLKCSY